jgi:hypothetical protein
MSVHDRDKTGKTRISLPGRARKRELSQSPDHIFARCRAGSLERHAQRTKGSAGRSKLTLAIPTRSDGGWPRIRYPCVPSLRQSGRGSKAVASVTLTQSSSRSLGRMMHGSASRNSRFSGYKLSRARSTWGGSIHRNARPCRRLAASMADHAVAIDRTCRLTRSQIPSGQKCYLCPRYKP